jgi:kynurenine formamidase
VNLPLTNPGLTTAEHPDWMLPWRPEPREVDAYGKVVGADPGPGPHNWGRWGEHDQLGTINLLTDETRRHASSLVRSGRLVSCAIPVGGEMPVHPSRPHVVHTHALTGSDMVAGALPDREYGGYPGCDDVIFMPLQSATHWDGLTHCSADGMFYNGYWVGTTGASAGARRLSTHLLAHEVAGRGVLLDVARWRGQERLRAGEAITAADLSACASDQGVHLRSGDIVLIRTGELGWFYRAGEEERAGYFVDGNPGLDLSTVEWFHAHDVAAAATDNRTFEVVPWADHTGPAYPLHGRLIRDLGLTIGELWWLDDLARICADQDRWEFFLAAAPLQVLGSSGSPAAPVAVL